MDITPIRPGTIVVGVDGSPQSDLAVDWAADQAHLEGRSLTLAHAGTAVAGHRLLELTRALVARDHPDVETHTLLRTEDPRELLLDLAERAGMLVVGSRGRGPVASLMLGSVGSAVTRHAPCPVVVLRPHDPALVTRGILVGIDARGRSRAAVEFAYRQASIRRLPLTVTHCSFDVVVGADEVPEIPYDTPGYELQRLVVDESVAGMGEKFPDVRVTRMLGRGLADTYLSEAGRAHAMVVVGSHTDGNPLASLLERNADRSVLVHAPGTIAVVPEPR